MSNCAPAHTHAHAGRYSKRAVCKFQQARKSTRLHLCPLWTANRHTLLQFIASDVTTTRATPASWSNYKCTHYTNSLVFYEERAPRVVDGGAARHQLARPPPFGQLVSGRRMLASNQQWGCSSLWRGHRARKRAALASGLKDKDCECVLACAWIKQWQVCCRCNFSDRWAEIVAALSLLRCHWWPI